MNLVHTDVRQNAGHAPGAMGRDPGTAPEQAHSHPSGPAAPREFPLPAGRSVRIQFPHRTRQLGY